MSRIALWYLMDLAIGIINIFMTLTLLMAIKVSTLVHLRHCYELVFFAHLHTHNQRSMLMLLHLHSASVTPCYLLLHTDPVYRSSTINI